MFHSESNTPPLASRPLLPKHWRAAERTAFNQQGAEQELLHLPSLAEPQWEGASAAALAEMLGWEPGNPCCYLCLRCSGSSVTQWAPSSPTSSFTLYIYGRCFSTQRVPLIWGCTAVHPREPNFKWSPHALLTQTIMNDPNLKRCGKRPASWWKITAQISILKPLCVWSSTLQPAAINELAAEPVTAFPWEHRAQQLLI